MVIERPGPGEWRGPGQAERRRRSAHELAKKFRDLEDPDLAVIVQWLKCNPSKHYRLYRSGLFDHIYDGEPEGESCPLFFEWEFWLFWLRSFKWDQVRPLAGWERVAATDRRAHMNRIARLAQELAEALESDGAVPTIDYAEAVDELVAEAILGDIWDSMADLVPAENLPYSREDFVRAHPTMGGLSSTQLSIYTMLREQSWPNALRQLAHSAKRKAQTAQPRDARPATGHPEARLFARYLADNFFKQMFDRTPNAVIAACVRLKFPDLDIPPDEGTIRSWRGAR